MEWGPIVCNDAERSERRMETTEEPRAVQVRIKEAWRRIRTRLNARLQEGVATEFIGGSKPYDGDLETCNYYRQTE